MRRVVVVAALLAGLAFAVVVARAPIAGWLLRERLAREGLEVRSLEVSTLSARGVSLRSLALARGSTELHLERVEASFTPGHLLAGTVDLLRLDGLRLEIQPSGEGVVPGGAPGAAGNERAHPKVLGPADRSRAPAPAPRFPLPVLPFRALEVSNAQARIATAGEHFVATGDATASVDGDRLVGEGSVTLDAGFPLTGQIRLGPDPTSFALDVEVTPSDVRLAVAATPIHLLLGASSGGGDGDGGDPPLHVRGELPATSVRATAGAEGSPSFTIETRGGWLGVPELSVEARGIEVEARGAVDAPEHASLSVQLRELRDTHRPERIAPVAVALRAVQADEGVAVEGTARRLDDVAMVEFAGRYDIATGSLRADLRLEPVVFAADGLQPGDLSARLSDFASAVSGSVEAVGTARWQDGAIEAVIDVALRDVAATTPNARLEGVNAVVRVTGPSPVNTPPGQLLSIGFADVGVGLSDIRVAFQILSETSLAVESAELHFAGGTLRTQGILDLGADEQRLPVHVAGVDLSELLALVKLDGLEGRGSVSGLLPIARRAEAIEIRDGWLESPAGGRIRYRPDAGMANLARNQQSLRELFDALEDFRYERLTLGIDGTTEGDVQLSLHLAGANPRYRDGQPVEFNLNLQARLVDLLRREQAAYRLADDIADRLGAFTDRAANIDRGSDVEAPEP